MNSATDTIFSAAVPMQPMFCQAYELYELKQQESSLQHCYRTH